MPWESVTPGLSGTGESVALGMGDGCSLENSRGIVYIVGVSDFGDLGHQGSVMPGRLVILGDSVTPGISGTGEIRDAGDY